MGELIKNQAQSSGQIRSANLRGLKTAWISEGPNDKPILLFLHGYPDTPHSWAHQISYFSKNFQVIAPFGRGVRPSEPGRRVSRYGFEATSLDFLEILKIEDPHNERRVALIGHDIGGAQAWHLAQMLARRLWALAIINSLPANLLVHRFKSQPQQILRSWYMLPLAIPKIADAPMRRFSGKVLQTAHRIGGLAPEQRPSLAKTITGVMHPINHYRAYFRAFPKIASHTPRRIAQPVLTIWGEGEPFLMRITQDELDRYAAKGDIRVLRGGHWLHREHPQTINKIIEEFLCSAT